ncbi:MAG: aspartate kinase [Bacteroidota bacterium]
MDGLSVFKFGGASVRDAEAVRNVAHILRGYSDRNLVIIVSAMGKTTNALERLVNAYFEQGDWARELDEIIAYHADIMAALFPAEDHPVHATAGKVYDYIRRFLEQEELDFYDYVYDQIVPAGELLSTKLVHAFLEQEGLQASWLDARKVIRTDDHYREANVQWEETAEKLQKALEEMEVEAAARGKIIVTQGFIGATRDNRMTSLGREGSDYSAAIIAYAMDAEETVIWKDVPGMLNADPKWFNNTTKLRNISYREAIELAYFGASVIHPKTVKPLQNKQIPLRVRSFLDPEEEGTLIDRNTSQDSLVPSYIFKQRQVLISISPRDFSFIAEDNLSDVFAHFSACGVSINTMQNSAISFSVSVDADAQRIPKLIEALQQDYAVKYNENLQLLTIRHYDDRTIEQLTEHKEVLLEQRSRQTIRLLMKEKLA